MTRDDVVYRVRIAQMMLCAAAVQRHIGQTSDATLVNAASDYAIAVNEWRKAVESALDSDKNHYQKIEAQA